jgi:tripartite-type tricarboxylate transporter receptor subunit TctC
MEEMMKLVGAALAATFALTLSASSASAQTFPSKPITWVVGFTPGGVSDNGARFVAKVFGEKLGQPVVIENKPGAGGIVAAEYVASSKPDGYTILYASNGVMGTYQSLYKKLSYDALKSFTLIHGFGSSPLVLVVPENSPFKSLKDLVDYGKKNPGKLSYASVGAGSASHLVSELMGRYTDIKLNHIPYKGSAPGMADLLGGRIDFMFDYSIVVKPQIDGGKLRALATSGEKRLVSHPDVPTFAELGYPDVKLTAWATIVGPAGMPPAIVEKLGTVFNETLKDPAVVKYHDEQGVALMPDVGPEKLRAFIVSEQAKFKDIIERTGATAD